MNLLACYWMRIAAGIHILPFSWQQIKIVCLPLSVKKTPVLVIRALFILLVNNIRFFKRDTCLILSLLRCRSFIFASVFSVIKLISRILWFGNFIKRFFQNEKEIFSFNQRRNSNITLGQLISVIRSKNLFCYSNWSLILDVFHQGNLINFIRIRKIILCAYFYISIIN